VRDDPTVVALVHRARSGDHTAWNELVERYAPLVWSICQRHRLTTAEAEDVGQNVWLLLIEHLATIREPAALPGWLATTTRRECVKAFRAKAQHDRVEAAAQRELRDDAVESSTAEDWLLLEERNAALRLAFAELPEGCRRLLELLLHDPPMSYAEIGRQLGAKVGGLGPRRARCLDKLRHSPPVAALIGADPHSERGEEHDQSMVER
jgi:RNA polymerase sigma factor (sigma-70 family)